MKNRSCFYCEKHITNNETTLDHIIPSDAGGTLGYNNVVLACEPCNQEKNNMSLKQYTNKWYIYYIIKLWYLRQFTDYYKLISKQKKVRTNALRRHIGDMFSQRGQLRKELDDKYEELNRLEKTINNKLERKREINER